jgi:signal transduction histidine kinase
MKKITLNRSVRFFLILFCITLLCGAAFYFISLPHGIIESRADNGHLTVSDPLVYAGGDWEFFYGEFLKPGDDFSEPDYINVPSSWGDAGYPVKGYATYRLVVHSDYREIAMLIPEIENSSVVFINGEEVFRAGTPTVTAESNRQTLKNALIAFYVPEDGAEIIIQASNYTWVTAGIIYDILIGEPTAVLLNTMVRRIVLGMFIGCLLTVGVYFLVVFLTDRKQNINLVLSVAAFLSALRFTLETNGLADMFFPGGIGPILTRVYLASAPIVVLLLLIFTYKIFSLPHPRRPVLVFYALLFIIALINALTLSSPYVLIAVMLIPVIICFILALRTHPKSPYMRLYTGALGIFCVWAILTKIIWGDRLYMPAIASNLFMLLSQCVMLTEEYYNTRRESEETKRNNLFLDNLLKSKSDHMAAMTHDLKTPLAVISANIQAAKIGIKTETDSGSASVITQLSDAEAEIMRMADMISNSVRDFSDSTGMEMSDISLTELIKTLAGRYKISMVEKNNTLEYLLPPEDIHINGNADLLRQMLENLLTNANRHTASGEISLTLRAETDGIIITVADNGEGIKADLLPHIFERSFSGAGSTGLGLSIAKNIAKIHGGSIYIDSTESKGTTVTIFLPFAAV